MKDTQMLTIAIKRCISSNITNATKTIYIRESLMLNVVERTSITALREVGTIDNLCEFEVTLVYIVSRVT